MSGLDDIAVRVEPGPRAGLGGGVTALLHEIAALLERLEAGGAGEAIDLRSLPLAPAERERLRATLGAGEVEATVSADGRSRVCETAIPAVWWIEHCDARGEMLAELIEVAWIPEFLMTAAGEAGRGAKVLRERIAGGGRGAQPEEAT